MEKRYLVHVTNMGFYLETVSVFLPGAGRTASAHDQKRFEAGKAALMTFAEADALVRHITERGGECKTVTIEVPE